MKNLEIKNIDCHAMLAMTKNTQSGRSMIEMLGVLAIIGVLSVGGIAGYSKAMLRYRVNKSIEQVSLISQNVRSFFAAQRNYAGLDSVSQSNTNGLSLIKKAKLVPDEMIDESSSIEDDDLGLTHHIFNAFGGGVVVWNDEEGASVEDCGSGDGLCNYFDIVFFRLPPEACIELATQDWRSSAMGITTVQVRKFEYLDSVDSARDCINVSAGITTEDGAIACPNGTTVPIPMPLDIAVDACDCPNNDCSIMWTFK